MLRRQLLILKYSKYDTNSVLSSEHHLRQIMKCYVCNSVIKDSTKSREHIPPSCIGGRLKPKTLICRNCNNELTAIDEELCTHLRFFTNRLDPRRRRSPPNVRGRLPNTNITAVFEPGAKHAKVLTSVEKACTNGSRSFSVTAGTREGVQRVINELRKKHPEIKLNRVNERRIRRLELPPLILGTEKEFRSVCKIAANYYVSIGGDPLFIGPSIRYIKNGVGGKRVWFYYPDAVNKTHRPQEDDKVFHKISLKGGYKDKLLYAHVELYNAFKYVVLLNDHYCGGNVDFSYSLDVVNGTQSRGKTTIDLSRDQLFELTREYAAPEDVAITHIAQLIDLIYTIKGYGETALSLKEYLERSFNIWSDNLLSLYRNGFLEHGSTLIDFARGFDIGFLYEIEALLYPIYLSYVAGNSEERFYRSLDSAIEEAEYSTLQRYPAGTPINRDLLLFFVKGLLTQMLSWVDKNSSEAIGAFIESHKPQTV